MKRSIPFATLLMMAGSLMAADSDAIKAAASKLAASDSYSWKTTSEAPGGGGGGGGGRFRQGPIEGKTEKNGYTVVSFTQGDNTTEVVLKGTNGAVKAADADWQSLADAAKDDGSGGFNATRFMAMRMQAFKTPAQEAEALAGQLTDVKMADGAYSGTLPEEAVKQRMAFGRPGGGGGGPEITNAKGSAKVWITDGVLTKIELTVQGHVEFNGNGRDMNRTTTTEIKDVGKTKVEAPDAAKKKIS